MRYKRIVIMSDSGPHFACSLFLAHMLCHMMREYRHLQSVAVSFAPPGHGKCPCDGEFGRLRSFRDTLARMHWVDSVSQYASLLQGHAERLYEKCTSRPLREFISYELLRRRSSCSLSWMMMTYARQASEFGALPIGKVSASGPATHGVALRCAQTHRGMPVVFWEHGFGGLHARLVRLHSFAR